jgi:protein gp37
MENSKIEWTDHTFNPWIGCQEVSPGCANCYAKQMMDHRLHRVEWGPHGERKRTSAQNWTMPLRWARHARDSGIRQRVFCASLADVWDNSVSPQWRADLFSLINSTPELDWLLLTKRPENICKMWTAATAGFTSWPFANVWLGTTCETQEYYDHRWYTLCQIPAAVHFISYEPALGPLSLGSSYHLPDWIICGGESGKDARMMDPVWAENVLNECRHLRVAFFMKQMTKKEPIPDHLLVRQFPTARQFGN